MAMLSNLRPLLASSTCWARSISSNFASSLFVIRFVISHGIIRLRMTEGHAPFDWRVTVTFVDELANMS
jgi:hypothetical protein